MKPLALASFCGGPLLASGPLKAIYGEQTFFVVFAPVLVMFIGAFCLLELQGWPARLVGLAGAVGAATLCALNVWALGWLWWHPRHELLGMHLTGIALSVPAVWLYARLLINTPRPGQLARRPETDAPRRLGSD